MATIADKIASQGQSIANQIGDAASAASSAIQTSANIFTDAVDSISAIPDKINGAVDDITANATKASASAIAGSSYTGGPIKNKLGKFASYNYRFTFGPLTNDEVNYPDSTYRKNGPSIVILRSGGTGDNQVQHLYDKQRGSRTEYFIDNVEINCLIAPNPKTRQTNATGISFTVIEPYSMGMFLQTLQVAAMQAGHPNYLEAPYLLQVDFVGWDDNGNPTTIPQTKRMFPLKLSNTSFNVSEQGSTYSVDAIPWHEQAFSDEIQSIKTDLDLEGETLLEMLQTGPTSLATQLNTREVEKESAKNKSTGDQFVVLFPTSRSTADEGVAGQTENNAGATTQSGQGETRDLTDAQKKALYYSLTGIQHSSIPADFDTELNKILGLVVKRSALGETVREFAENEENVNDLGKSKIAKSYLDTGKTYFGKPGFVEDEENPGVFKRGNITISNEAKKIQFPKGTKVQDIIEELVLLSEYGRNFITETPDANGMKKWFKIETDVYNVDDPKNIQQTGASPKVFVYRVVPYKVQSSKIAAPTEVPPGYKNLKKQALKEYNYIYTGKNDDIINFDIQINSAFFTAIMSDFGQLHADEVSKGRDGATQPNDSFVCGESEGRDDVNSQSGTAKRADADPKQPVG